MHWLAICVRFWPQPIAEHQTGQMETDASNSVIEIHTFLVTLVRQFDFSLLDDGREVRKMRPGIITPVMVGEEHKGPQLLLKVAALRDE